MRKLLAAAALLALSASPALALGIAPCGDLNRIDNLVAPFDKYTKSFYEGEVFVALIDTVEPACCSAYILVFMPPPGEESPYGSACYALSQDQGENDMPGLGFNGLDWDGLKTNYDPAKGLLLTFEHGTWDGSGEPGPRKVSKVRINMKDKSIQAE